ncbi:SHOCT-like domain-containing protein, partial [Roseiflexus sp.]
PPEAVTGATIRINGEQVAGEPAPAVVEETQREEPAPSDVTTQSPGATLEEQRAAILRMVAEGRITPEEADLLLEALG